MEARRQLATGREQKTLSNEKTNEPKTFLQLQVPTTMFRLDEIHLTHITPPPEFRVHEPRQRMLQECLGLRLSPGHHAQFGAAVAVLSKLKGPVF
jgi:hypothetical protein